MTPASSPQRVEQLVGTLGQDTRKDRQTVRSQLLGQQWLQLEQGGNEPSEVEEVSKEMTITEEQARELATKINDAIGGR